jgi:hypothetical protein
MLLSSVRRIKYPVSSHTVGLLCALPISTHRAEPLSLERRRPLWPARRLHFLKRRPYLPMGLVSHPARGPVSFSEMAHCQFLVVRRRLSAYLKRYFFEGKALIQQIEDQPPQQLKRSLPRLDAVILILPCYDSPRLRWISPYCVGISLPPTSLVL